MDEMKFWEIVQQVHDQSGGDMDKKCGLIEAEVSKLSNKDAIAFSHLFYSMMHRLYTWPLWGAAYVILVGPCSDDNFWDFRTALISRGRKGFEKALSNPDLLADEIFDGTDWFYEGYQYAVEAGVEAAVDRSPQSSKPLAVDCSPPTYKPFPDGPLGARWMSDEVFDLLPKLTERVGMAVRARVASG